MFGKKHSFTFADIEKIIVKWGSVKLSVKNNKKAIWIMGELDCPETKHFIATAKEMNTEIEQKNASQKLM